MAENSLRLWVAGGFVTALLLVFAVPCLAATGLVSPPPQREPSNGNPTISARDAANHAGERATVCGRVASVYYASRSRARPTFLDFGADYPRETFVAVIFHDDRGAFGRLAGLRGRKACVTGPIELYRGKPEIILHDPSQLRRG